MVVFVTQPVNDVQKANSLSVKSYFSHIALTRIIWMDERKKVLREGHDLPASLYSWSQFPISQIGLSRKISDFFHVKNNLKANPNLATALASGF